MQNDKLKIKNHKFQILSFKRGKRGEGMILLILFIMFSHFLVGAEVSVVLEADRTKVCLGEQIVLTVTLSGSFRSSPDPEIAGLEDFSCYSSGRSQNISIINGQISTSTSFTYILTAEKKGKFIIGPAKVKIKGKIYQSNQLTIEVSDVSTPRAGTPPSSRPPSVKPEFSRGEETEKLFIRLRVDKEKAYVQEQITLTFAFYQAVNLVENPSYEPPATTGFWTEDLPPQKKYYQTINGRQYLVTEIKTALFPTAPGSYILPPAKLKCKVRVRTPRRRRSIFDDPWFDDFDFFGQTKVITLKSNPVRLEILPLPEPKPAGFKGAIGEFKIRATLDKSEVKVNDPLVLKIKIKGQGNIKTVPRPEIQSPPHFKIYPSQHSTNLKKENYLVSGEKVIEYMLIPTRAGSYTLPAINFVYFNPRLKKYQTAKTRSFDLNVQPGEKKKPQIMTAITDVNQQEVKFISRDILYLKPTLGKLEKKGNYLLKIPLFWGIHCFPLIILCWAFFYQQHRLKLKEDPKYFRMRKAYKKARKELTKLKYSSAQIPAKEFYEKLFKIITEYLADRLNTSAPSLSTEKIKNLLSKKTKSSTLNELIKLLEDCNLVRFASLKLDQARRGADWKKTRNILSVLEKSKL